ncbi:MAG TPA: hypothetical protein VGL16_02215 [Actinomycetota bacterium]|jgi:hypothetical protein
MKSPESESFGLLSEVPTAARITGGVNRFISLTLSRQSVLVCFGLAATIVLPIFISAKVREAADSFPLSLLTLGVLYGVEAIQALLWSQIAVFLQQAGVGKSAFRRLDLWPRALLKVLVCGSSEMTIELTDEQQQIMERIALVDRERSKAEIRNKFIEASGADDDQPDVESTWERFWEDEYLGGEIRGASIGEAFYEPPYGAMLLLPRLFVTARLILPLYGIALFVLTWLAYRAVSGPGAWLTVFQVALALGFSLSMLIFVNHVYTFAEVTVLDPTALLPGYELTDEEKSLYDEIRGRKIRLRKVTLHHPGYFRAVGGYFARQIAVATGYVILSYLLLVAITLAVGLLVAPDSRDELWDYYGELAIGLALLPPTLVGAHFLAFLVLENPRNVAAEVIAASLLAVVPLAAKYLIFGESPDTADLISAVVTGLSAALVALLVVRLKRPTKET